MASSQDHKRLLNNDMGPNTGGMGAYSPAPIIDAKLHERVIKEIIQPVIDGMHSEGHEYTGFLYAGLMIDSNGNPKTLEYNCRFGDPETQPIMMRLKTDLASLIQSGFKQQLNQVQAEWEDKFALGVVLASSGYPDAPRKNDIITGLEQLNLTPGIKVFHAGIKVENQKLYTSGGRVNTYQALKEINFAGMQFRTDIGNNAKN